MIAGRRDLAERQKALLIYAEFDKTGVEAGVDIGHPSSVNVALKETCVSYFDFELVKTIVFDYGCPDLLGSRGVDQHEGRQSMFLWSHSSTHWGGALEVQQPAAPGQHAFDEEAVKRIRGVCSFGVVVPPARNSNGSSRAF